jgi:hypothetical protein
MCCSNFRLLFVFGGDSNLYILRCNISYFIICLKKDILYPCRTQIQKVKHMMDILLISIPAFWVAFACCLVWYLTSAKKCATITFDDAKALWYIHKNTARCTSRKWRPLSLKSGKISVFECNCGYRYTQKRPILSSRPKNGRIDPRNQAAFSAVSY